jgi:hypothetical protein
MISFVVSVLGRWCSMSFGDLDWYHYCPGFRDVCASCDLKLLPPNGLYGCGYCILRLCHCHSKYCTIWILTLYSLFAIHWVQVYANHLRIWKCWVSFGLHEGFTHLSVLCRYVWSSNVYLAHNSAMVELARVICMFNFSLVLTFVANFC